MGTHTGSQRLRQPRSRSIGSKSVWPTRTPQGIEDLERDQNNFSCPASVCSIADCIAWILRRTASPSTAPAAASPTTDVNILGRVYKVACADGEEHALNEAVVYLDKQMREIRDRGKVSGIDRIAVMAALNIAHEVLRARSGKPATGGFDSTAIQRRISAMQTAIDRAMAEQEKLF